MNDKPRTNQQNKALHLYFTLACQELTGAGLDIKKVVADIPWTPYNFKEYIWRPIQIAMTGKQSTTQLTTKEIDLIWEAVNRTMAEMGLHVDFPSIDSIINQQRTQ